MEFYEPMITTPILHVLGTLDTIVDEERSLSLVGCCAGAKEKGWVVTHPGGHYVPMGKAMVGVLAGFIAGYLEGMDSDPEVKIKEQEEKEESVEDMNVPF